MRLNTRNLIFIGVGAIVMGLLIFFGTRSGEDTPEPTETAAETGDLFPDLTAEQVVRFEIRSFERELNPEEPTATPSPTPTPPPPGIEPPIEPIEPAEVVMEKDAENFWTITSATNSSERGTDQATVVGVIANVVDLSYADRFDIAETDAELADFGLDNPAYEIVLSDGEADYTLVLGDTNPGGQRYYAQLEPGSSIIYLVTTGILNNVVNYTLEPPYVPAPTDTPTPFPTANPFSEVEQTATAQVEFEATATAIAEFSAMMTATANVGPAPVDATEEATTDDEATEEAATDDEATEEATTDDEATEEAATDDEASSGNIMDTLALMDAEANDDD